MPQVPSSRWCPTPEQLMILEEMYRSGVRTPNASQIQQITAHLSYYGRIEGKNVFYWFQNHKARERQKLRRRLSRHHHLLCGALIPHQPWQYYCWPETPRPPLSLSSPASFHSTHAAGTLSNFYPQESTKGLDLLCKMENTGRWEELSKSTSNSSGLIRPTYEWMAMVDAAGSPVDEQYCCRPIKTLDLFPTSTVGLKDEYCTTSKSSFTN